MIKFLFIMIAFNMMIKFSKVSTDNNNNNNHLNFDLRNNKLNLVEMEVSINENNNINNSNSLTNEYNHNNNNNKKHQQQVKKSKKILKFDEISNKLKQDALIDVFKIKLLELLDLDEAPSPSDFNININPVPEPIMREYNKLLKISQQDINNNNNNNKHSSSAMYSRRIRDKQSDTISNNNINNNNNHHIDHDHELIRFNSSVVQEVTLLPNRVKSKQDPTVLYFNSQNDWCNTNESLYTLLSCFKFNLDQKEFLSNDLKSAEMYMKLDLNSLKQLLINKQSMLDEESLDELAYLYLEVNGNLLKRIHLLKDESYIEYVDLKQLMEHLISIMNKQRQTTLRVRLLTSNFLIDSLSPIYQEEFKHIFLNIDELVALRIKFGDIKPKLIESNNKQQRNKRQPYLYSSSSDTSKSSSRGNRHRTGGSKQATKNYRDCADLRKLGQTSANFTCCRETISFSMEQIGWSHWILSPKVIEYKYCRGGCISGVSPRFDNTQIVYRMFELSNTFESTHCCNIYDYEEDIPFIYGTPPNYQTKMVSLNAKTCLCS